MLALEWTAAGSGVVIALTSVVAVLIWRDGRRKDRETRQRDHEAQIGDRILESARREFSTKEELGGLKSTLAGLGALGLLIAGLAVWDKLSPDDD
jgi:hypothetical protein